MSKQCKSCGTDAPENAKFCPMCGGVDFVEGSSAEQQGETMYSAPTNPQPAVNPTAYQAPTQQNPPKKKKTGLIIGIVAAVVVVWLVTGFFVGKAVRKIIAGNEGELFGDHFGTSTNDDGNIEMPDVDVEKAVYSKGALNGSVYTNKWADIQFEIPEGYLNADADTYAMSENETTECGLYIYANDNSSIMYIQYEKLPTYPSYDEADYLDAVVLNLETEAAYQLSGTYAQISLGGYRYLKADCNFTNDYGNFVHTLYARKIGNYMALISVMGVSAETNDALLGTMTQVK